MYWKVEYFIDLFPLPKTAKDHCKRIIRIHNVDKGAAKLLQSCPTLCEPRDSSTPGSPVPGILQAGTLEWVAISWSSAWKCKVKVKFLGRVRLLAKPWTAAHQAPPSMGFSRQVYWSEVPLPSLPYMQLCYAMLSHFSRVWLCATPEKAAHQAPPSLGFSRQEHWSGWKHLSMY